MWEGISAPDMREGFSVLSASFAALFLQIYTCDAGEHGHHPS